MKFGDLIILFRKEIEKFKKDNTVKKKVDKSSGKSAIVTENPSLKYIIIAYYNVLKKLEDFSDTDVITKNRINNMELTPNMKEKLLKLSRQPITKEITDQRKTFVLKQKLGELLGIGDKKIDYLVQMGMTKVDQIYQKKYFDTLNTDTQMTLTYKPDRFIKWETAHQFEHLLTGFDSRIVIVGSYRRKKPVVHDIDILFLEHDNITIADYIKYLKNVFKDHIWFYSNGEQKTSMIFQPPVGQVKYKADIFITTIKTYYPTLLYTTGSKFHNIKMRARAKRLKLLLNQNGLFNGSTRINTDYDDEKKLFKYLDMEYLEPEKRF